MSKIKLEDIRVRTITYKEKGTSFWKKRGKVLWVDSYLEVKYNDEWIPLNQVEEDKFI